MRLYYMRHGQAEPYAASDAERPLTPHGQNQVIRVARWLAKQAILPALCINSPFLRARQTVEHALAQLPSSPQQCESNCLTPDEPSSGVFALLDRFLEVPCILLVGHNPLASDFVDVAVAGRYGAHLAPLPTAGLAVLEADVWAPGTARLVGVITPDQVKL